MPDYEIAITLLQNIMCDFREQYALKYFNSIKFKMTKLWSLLCLFASDYIILFCRAGRELWWPACLLF